MNSTYIISMAVLILLSACFSATETAFSSLNKTRLKTLAEKGNRRAKLTCTLSEQYDKLISTILIGNNIVNIASASLGTVIFVKLYGDIGATVSTVVITVLVLIFGEITPKSIAKDCPEKFAMASAPFIRLLIWLFAPLNYVFSLWKRLVFRLLRLENDSRMSQDELLMLVEEVQQDGSIDRNEGELLRSAIEFTEREAGDILTHRVELEAVSVDAAKEEIDRVFTESGFSRVLVYEDSIDSVIGVLHQKDFYGHDGISEKEVRALLSPVLYVMKTEKISSLLRTMQQNKAHVSVVLDEYGGTFGMVTMEDILEELVGEIWDEHDEVPEPFREVSPGVYRVDGSVDLSDFCAFFQTETDSEMISLGGWLIEKLGHPAEIGDSIVHETLSVRVTAMESHRVTEAEIRKTAGNE